MWVLLSVLVFMGFLPFCPGICGISAFCPGICKDFLLSVLMCGGFCLCAGVLGISDFLS